MKYDWIWSLEIEIRRELIDCSTSVGMLTSKVKIEPTALVRMIMAIIKPMRAETMRIMCRRRLQ